MNVLYFYSFWLLIWSILFYLKILSIPPLYHFIIISLIFSIIIYFKYNINNINIFLIIIIIHIIPLFLINFNRNMINNPYYLNEDIVMINILLPIIYVIFMKINNKNIKEFYKKSYLIFNKGIIKFIKFLFN